MFLFLYLIFIRLLIPYLDKLYNELGESWRWLQNRFFFNERYNSNIISFIKEVICNGHPKNFYYLRKSTVFVINNVKKKMISTNSFPNFPYLPWMQDILLSYVCVRVCVCVCVRNGEKDVRYTMSTFFYALCHTYKIIINW